MKKIKYTKELLEPFVKRNISLRGVIKDLGLSYSNGSSQVISKAIKRNNINTEHFCRENKTTLKYKNEEIFTKESNINRSTVKKRIIKDNLIKYECNSCGCNDKWMGKTMPLILDHINGLNNDNRLENLRFLCSNCDSIQDTYKSKNINQTVKTKILRNKLIKLSEIEKKRSKINQKREDIIKRINFFNINFSESGWRLKLGEIFGWTPQYAGIFVKKYMSETWKMCFKHIDRK